MVEADDGRAAGMTGPAGDGVDAYESDWYRSLKALAERQAALAGEDEEAESEAERDPAAVATDPHAPDNDAAVIDLDAEHPDGDAGSDVTGAAAEAPPVDRSRAVSAEPVRDAEPVTTGPTEAATPGPDAPPEADATQEVDATPDADGAPDPITDEPVAGSAEPTAPQPSLDAPDPDLRREALVALTDRGLAASDVERVLALAKDPDQQVRRQALAALEAQADLLPDPAVQQALQDPDDEVRAQAVHLAAARGERDLGALLPLLAARHSPATQVAALTVLPDLVARAGESEEHMSAALYAVARIDSKPTPNEAGPLAELARGLGVAHLTEQLSATDDRRLGAVRLLRLEGSAGAMRALAELTSDPIEEIRTTAEEAAAHVAELERASSPPAPPAPDGTTQVEQAAESEMITALARALTDPDEGVRQRAISALTDVERPVMAAWVDEAARAEDPELPAIAAQVAQLRGLTESIPALLDRGAALAGERQEPFRRALAAIPIESDHLVRALDAVAAERKPAAVHFLWEVAGRAALPALEQRLGDPSPEVRTAVLDVLASSGEAGAAEAASRSLASDSAPSVRAAAIAVVARGSVDERIAALGQALADPDPSVRAAAVAALPAGTGRAAADLLIRAMDDLDDRVWRAALPHLASLATDDLETVWSALVSARPEQRAELIDAMAHADAVRVADLALQHAQAPDPDERRLAVALAGQGATDASVQACVQALQDPVADVRRQAAASLGRIRSPQAVSPLGGSLSDPDPGVREQVVRALGVIDSEAVLGFLVQALQDPSAQVRETASQVLTEWSSPAVARRLAGVLATPALRDQAIDLLTKMGGSATELLVDVLLHSTPDMVPTVGGMLEQLVGVDHFVERLHSMDPKQRRRAMTALAAIGGPQAVEHALTALGDPDPHVRTAAVTALAALGDPRTADAVARVADSDPIPEVADAARTALATLRPA